MFIAAVCCFCVASRKLKLLQIAHTLLFNCTEASLSNKVLPGLGQTYGVGKTSIVENLVPVLRSINFFETTTTIYDWEPLERLKASVFIPVDLRNIGLNSYGSLEQVLWNSVVSAFGSVSDRRIELLRESILKHFEAYDVRTLKSLFSAVQDHCKTKKLNLLLLFDEIDFINSIDNRHVTFGDMRGTNDYQRLLSLWRYISISMEYDRIFTIIAGRSSLLPLIGKGDGHSPTGYLPVILPGLTPNHVKTSFKLTKVKIPHDSFFITSFDILQYLCGYDTTVVTDFFTHCDSYSSGIPRIVSNVSLALLGLLKPENEGKFDGKTIF